MQTRRTFINRIGRGLGLALISPKSATGVVEKVITQNPAKQIARASNAVDEGYLKRFFEFLKIVSEFKKNNKALFKSANDQQLGRSELVIIKKLAELAANPLTTKTEAVKGLSGVFEIVTSSLKGTTSLQNKVFDLITEEEFNAYSDRLASIFEKSLAYSILIPHDSLSIEQLHVTNYEQAHFMKMLALKPGTKEEEIDNALSLFYQKQRQKILTALSTNQSINELQNNEETSSRRTELLSRV